MHGFFGRILRIDLGARDYRVEPLNQEVLRRYLGGKGLGSYVLNQEVKPGVDPLSPDNKLIFTTGAACGTNMPGASRYGVFTKSPLTGIYAESYSGGRVAPAMKRTGYDAIVIEGRSPYPVFLDISSGGVTFYEAAHLWGLDTYDAEDKVLREVGDPRAQALVIGPAGERLVRFACIENNYWRSAGRAGTGAVMGAKKLKAIVFRGTAEAEIADPSLLKDLVTRIRDKAKGDGGAKNYKTYGTPVMVSILNKAGVFPSRYWSRGQAEYWEEINGEALLEKFTVRPRACPHCMLACGKLTSVTQGKHAGLTIEGPEYETIYSFGGLCEIRSLDDIIYLNDLCDRLGMDTITAGNLVGLVMEGVESGRLKEGPRYGDVAGTADLLRRMAGREGLGAVLAEGIKQAAPELGLDDLAVHVKGLEPAGYHPRILKGMGLAYATSSRGACHLRATFYKPELAGMIDPATVEGKAKLFVEFEDRLTVFNTQILCVFFRDLIQWKELQTLIEATTGWRYSDDELRDLGNRVVGLTRAFNVQEGITNREDTLPDRMFTDPPLDSRKSHLTREELERMVSEYYVLRGWDAQGRPC